MPFKKEPDLYRVWVGMKVRCENPRFRQWKDYGGRGIDYCDAWKSFRQFEKDMGPRPTPDHQIDRIDNSKGYSPENCRWATRIQQQRNGRKKVNKVTIEGIEHYVPDLARQSGMKTDTLLSRVKRDPSISLAELLNPTPNRDFTGLALGVQAKAAKAKARTHCAHGHVFTEENTYITPEGWKSCRDCRLKENRLLRE